MSGGAVNWAHSVLLKTYTDDGISGIAECGDTSMGYMGESQESIRHNVSSIFGPGVLLGEDPFKIETIIAKMDTSIHLKVLVLGLS